jgi:F-type H+-transporting ATPase subunit delta
MSNLATLARPYAKAAFELADGQNALAGWERLLGLAADIVSDESVARLLGNPMVARKDVIGVVKGALDEELHGFEGFLSVLGDNDRLALLPEIAGLFRGLREKAEKRLSVRVVSAVPLGDDQAERMKQALAKRFNREIEMRNEIDASVLGGAVIYAGDQVIDGSLLGRLEKMRASLSVQAYERNN